MAKQTRKVNRAKSKAAQPSGKEIRAQMKGPPAGVENDAPAMPNPLAPAQLKSTAIRVGLILLVLWVLGAMGLSFSQSDTTTYLSIGIPSLLTVLVIGVLVWTFKRTQTAHEMAALIKEAQASGDRKGAIEKLKNGKRQDPARIFAQAQLEMQEEPKVALATLEQINLNKVSAAVADEARGQRAMIHLGLGQVSLARQLVDNIVIKRIADARSRAMIVAICAEAWARSGEARKALDTLKLVDQSDAALEQFLPQVLRAEAFAYAHMSKNKDLKKTLRRLGQIDIRLVGGFLQGKPHPLLAREAKLMLQQSGAVPRQMQVQRTR